MPPSNAWMQIPDAGFNPALLSRIVGPVLVPATSSYTGPGDIVSGANFHIGLWGYNGAYATGSNNCLKVRRASDNTTQNIVILTTGLVDIATANTFAGTDFTATGGTATGATSLALTGCSSTPTVGDTITAAVATGSLVQPCYITAVGTFTGGAGTVTLNKAQTCTLTSVVGQVGLFITELYDQTGNGINFTQATAGSQPQLLPLGGTLATLPYISFIGGFMSATLTSVNNPFFLSIVGDMINNSLGQATFFNYGNTYAGNLLYEVGTNTTAMYCNAGTTLYSATMSWNAWHALQYVFNGASPASSINVDGTQTTGGSSGGSSGYSGTGLTLGAWQGGSNQLFGGEAEITLWPINPSGTQLSNLLVNINTRTGL
jgi:hypothetical protein